MLIRNYYINDESCNILEKKINMKISHILKTAPTHSTEYDEKKGSALQNLDTSNMSVVGQKVNNNKNIFIV